MPVTLITDIADNKLAVAAGSETQVKITHVALGDGGGVAYNPDHGAVSLRREMARVAIEKRYMSGPKTWVIKAEFPPETAAFDVREMGFFDEDGELIAIWAGADVQSRRTGVISYLVHHGLNFSRVEEGLVIVDAPDDELFDFAIVMLGEQASQRLALFNMNEAQRAAHGLYGVSI